LSTVQMPGGIPVATVAVGKAGAKNAAYLAAQMLALSDPSLAQKLVDDRAANAATVQAQNDRVQAELGS
jgi:5-(carboxyamino)imidazole ribonucleotide mutase